MASHSALYQRFGVGHFIFRFLVFHHFGVFSLVVSCPASHLRLFLHYLLVVSFQFHNQWLWVYSVGPGYGVCLCYFDFSKFAFIFNMHLRCCFRVGEFCFLVSFSLPLSLSVPLTFPSLSIHHVIEHLLENVVCLYKHVCIDRIFCIITKAKIHIHFVLPVPFLSFSISTLSLVSMYLYISLFVSCSLVCTDKTEHFLVCVLYCIYERKKNLFDRRDTLYDYTMFSTQ